MSDSGFREIQLSGKQVVFLFMAGVVVAVGVFLLGVSVGRGVTDASAAADTTPAPATVASNAPLPPATVPKPGEFQATDTLQGKTPAPSPTTPPAAAAPAATSSPTPTPTPTAKPTAAVKPTPTPSPAKPAAAPASRPTPTSAAKPPASPTSGWYVQVDSFASRENASKQAAELKAKGYTASVYTAPGAGARYKVRIGPMERAAADTMIAKLRKEGYQPSPVR